MNFAFLHKVTIGFMATVPCNCYLGFIQIKSTFCKFSRNTPQLKTHYSSC